MDKLALAIRAGDHGGLLIAVRPVAHGFTGKMIPWFPVEPPRLGAGILLSVHPITGNGIKVFCTPEVLF